MIKTTIGNSSFSTEICFPCSETELSDKLGELGMDKEHFSLRSELISEDKLFSAEELEQIRNCVNFTAKHNSGLRLEDWEFLNKLNEKISENIPKQQSCSPEMSM